MYASLNTPLKLTKTLRFRHILARFQTRKTIVGSKRLSADRQQPATCDSSCEPGQPVGHMTKVWKHLHDRVSIMQRFMEDKENRIQYSYSHYEHTLCYFNIDGKINTHEPFRATQEKGNLLK